MTTDTIKAVNLSVVVEMLTSVKDLLEGLDGTSIDDPDSTRTKKEAVAEVTRDLLFVEHTLNSAAVLVKNEYWTLKGYNAGYGVYSDTEPDDGQ